MSTPSASPLSPHDDVLEQILARLDALEAAIRPLAQAVRDGPALVGTLADEVDRRYALGEPVPDVDALLERAPHLAAQAVNRRTLEALEHILSRLDALDEATRLLAQAVRDGPALVGALADEVDRFALQEGIDADAATSNALAALARLVRLAQSPAFAAFVEALDTTTLEFAARTAQAARETYEERREIKGVGLLGLLRTLGDADVKRALGFVVAVLRRLGRALGAR